MDLYGVKWHSSKMFCCSRLTKILHFLHKSQTAKFTTTLEMKQEYLCLMAFLESCSNRNATLWYIGYLLPDQEKIENAYCRQSYWRPTWSLALRLKYLVFVDKSTLRSQKYRVQKDWWFSIKKYGRQQRS